MFLNRVWTNQQVASVILIHRAAIDRAAAMCGAVHSGLAHDGKALSPTQKKRAKCVTEAKTPQEFAALYRKENRTKPEENGGSLLDRHEKHLVKLLASDVTGQSEIAFAANAEKWSERPKQEWSVKLPGLDLRKEVTVMPDLHPKLTLPSGEVIDDPDMFKCSWCQTYMHRSQATFGKGPLKDTKITEITIVNGAEVITSRWIKSSRSMVACPDHCLKLVNTKIGVDSHGEPIWSGTKTTYPTTT